MQWHETPALERLKRSRSALITNPAYAFFGCIALRLQLVPVPWCESASTDGESLFYNPAYIEGLKEGECMGLIAALVFHLARLHHTRRGGRDLARWNVAADETIHSDLLKLGFQLPGKAKPDPRFDGMSTESVYGILEREARQKQEEEEQDKPEQEEQDGGADEDAGSGSNGDDEDDSGDPDGGQDGNGQDDSGPGARPAPDPNGSGGVIDAAPDESTRNDKAAEMEAAVRQAVSVAKAANAGDLPAFLERLLGELNAPRIEWRSVVAQFVDDAATRRLEWSRPNKRYLRHSFYMPGKRSDSVSKLVLGVDSSGSIDKETLSVMRDNAQGILDTGKVESVVVIYCHHATHDRTEFRKGDSIVLDVKQTGGTLFGPLFRAVEEEDSDAAAIIYLTDLDPAASHPDAWGIEPDCPVLWAVIGSKRFAPFGTVLPVDIHA